MAFDSKDFERAYDAYQKAEADAEEARLKRPCGNCGLPWDEHIHVCEPFGMHTPIGGPPPTPLVTLCPSAVFKEPCVDVPCAGTR